MSDDPPLVVLRTEGTATVTALAEALGWRTTPDARQADPGVVLVARIDQPSGMADAVRAVAGGAGLLADVTALEDRAYLDLCDDLRRLGRRVRQRAAEDPLSIEAAALLDLLAAGWTLGAAAGALHLSRRSADRRLAQARAALGASTAAEAVIRTRSVALCRPAG